MSKYFLLPNFFPIYCLTEILVLLTIKLAPTCNVSCKSCCKLFVSSKNLLIGHVQHFLHKVFTDLMWPKDLYFVAFHTCLSQTYQNIKFMDHFENIIFIYECSQTLSYTEQHRTSQISSL